MAQIELFKNKASAQAYELAQIVLQKLESAHPSGGIEPVNFSEKNISRLIFFTAQDLNIKISVEDLNQAESMVEAVVGNVFVGEKDVDPTRMPSLTAGALSILLSQVDPKTRVFIDSKKALENYCGKEYTLEDAEGQLLSTVAPFDCILCHNKQEKAIVITTHY